MTTQELLSAIEEGAAIVEFIDYCLDKGFNNNEEVDIEDPFGVKWSNIGELHAVKQSVESTIEELGRDLYSKAQHLIEIVAEIDAKHEEAKARLASYQKMMNGYRDAVKRSERTLEFLKNRVLRSIIDMFGETDKNNARFVMVDQHKVRIIKTKAVEVSSDFDYSKLSPDLYKIEYTPKKAEIKKAIDSGIEMPDGICLKENEHVRIFQSKK